MSEYIVKCKKFTGITGNELEFPEYIDTNKEIVRCRNCKFYRPREGATLNCRFEHPSMPNTIEWCIAEPDGFCAWGERRTDDKQ